MPDKTRQPDEITKDRIFLSTSKKIIALLLLGLGLSYAAISMLSQYYQSGLIERAEAFAQSIDPIDVRALADSSITDNNAPIDQVKQKLEKLKTIDSETRFVYLMIKRGDDIVFLADSEPSGSDSYSARGDVYPDATNELRSFFETPRPFAEGPVHDDYGTWYSAIAPVKDDENKLVAAIGVDVPAATYLAAIFGIGSLPFILTMLISAAVFFYDASRKRRFETYRLQAELLSIASHELRSPLSGIRWSQEILLGAQPNELQLKMLTLMHDNTLRLQESIEDILQLASLEAGEMKMDRRARLNLADIVKDCMAMQQLSAKERGIAFVFDSSWVSTQLVIGDATHLRRVFNNIISNAIKYATNDTGVVFAYVQKDGNHHIAIRNKGIGIPKDEMSHIFDGFYRASNATGSAEPGSGMGLYMSRAIIEQHGGKLWLDSVENHETTVYIELPIAPEVVQETTQKK